MMKKTVIGSSAHSRQSISPSIDPEQIKGKDLKLKTNIQKAMPGKVQTLDFQNRDQKKTGAKASKYKENMEGKSDLDVQHNLSPDKPRLKLQKRSSSILDDDQVEKIYKEANTMLS